MTNKQLLKAIMNELSEFTYSSTISESHIIIYDLYDPRLEHQLSITNEKEVILVLSENDINTELSIIDLYNYYHNSNYTNDYQNYHVKKYNLLDPNFIDDIRKSLTK